MSSDLSFLRISRSFSTLLIWSAVELALPEDTLNVANSFLTSSILDEILFTSLKVLSHSVLSVEMSLGHCLISAKLSFTETISSFTNFISFVASSTLI